MKTTFKIIFVAFIGVFIGYSVANYTLTTDEVEIVEEDKVENIMFS